MSVNLVVFLLIHYFIYNLSINISFCFEIEIEVTNTNNRNKEMRFPRFNPFEEFLNMNDMASNFMNEINENFDKMEAEMNDSSSQELEVAEISKGHANSKKKNRSQNVHTEIFTSNQNGFQTIQITEVHVGHTGGHRPQADPNGIFSIGIPTIIVSKPKNLKDRNGHASPFNMFREIDEIFDTLFEDLTKKFIEAEFENDKINEMIDLEVINNPKNTHHEHEDHIVIKDIKDITKSENTEQEFQPKISSEMNNYKFDDEKLNKNSKAKVKSDIGNKMTENTREIEDHSLAISYTDQTKKDDQILTAKEKVKQIKDQRKKSYFSKLCKYVFYCITLFAFYVVIKKILILLNIVEDKPNSNSSQENSIEPTLETEMKTTNIKNE